jgi:hypothetical protein
MYEQRKFISQLLLLLLFFWNFFCLLKKSFCWCFGEERKKSKLSKLFIARTLLFLPSFLVSDFKQKIRHLCHRQMLCSCAFEGIFFGNTQLESLEIEIVV